LDCLSTNTSNPFTKVPLQHKVIYGSGEIIIEYELANSGPVKVEIFNMLGQPVTTLINAYQGAGMHRATFSIGNSILAAGYYVYSIQAGQQRASQKVLVSR
jgi:serine protease AprX